MTNRPEKSFNNALSRRDLLRLTAITAFSAALSPFEPLAATRATAQTEGTVVGKPEDPTRLLPLGEAEQPVVQTRIGVTTDKEIQSLPYLGRKLLQGGLAKYNFPSKAEARPNMVITEQGGVARFKRIFIAGALGPNAYVDTPQFNSFYGPPESIAPPPKSDFWEKLIPQPSETQVFAGQGFALVALKSNHQVYEIQVFDPTTVNQYLQTWAQVDNIQSYKAALILLDGLGSSLDAKRTGFEATFGLLRQDLSPFYDEVAPFSYLGGKMLERFTLPPVWSPNLYKASDTYQDIHKSAGILRDMVDWIRGYYKNIDLLGYSLGGFTAWQYLIENVMPERGPHRDNVIRSALLLDAPVNGVPGAELSYYLRGRDFDTQFGNDATNYLSALASSPKIQERTTELNRRSAEILRDRRNVRILCLANSEDCFVKPRSAIIPGFGYTLPLGRGANGIPNCDALLLAPTLPGDDPTNVGHTQILTDPRARSTIKYFLENQQGRQIDQSPAPSTHLTDLQIAEIGITTPQDLVSKYPGANKQTLESGDQRYSVTSTLDSRPSEVLFRGDKAIFERTVVLQAQDKALTISGLIARLGQPEKVMPGSQFYGYDANTYIYASKGIAIIGNPDIDAVFELQTFVSSSVNEYIRNYGQDIYTTQRRGEGP